MDQGPLCGSLWTFSGPLWDPLWTSLDPLWTSLDPLWTSVDLCEPQVKALHSHWDCL